jgi:uncharacterized protein (DUF2147 family)
MPALSQTHRVSSAVALVLALLLVLAALAAAQEPLVGKWRYPNGAIMEFSPEGVLTIKPANGGAENKMRYFVEDGSTLVMVQEDDQTLTTGFQVSANGKRLTIDSMDDGRGRPQEFLERIK